MTTIARNKKAFFDYEIEDSVEAGLVLLGAEIKAIRAKDVNITGSYIKPFADKSGRVELWWVGSHFGVAEGDQTRTKKLLLNRREIDHITGRQSAKGQTILPLELFINRGRAKLKIGLGTHKKPHDRREELRERAVQRDAERDWRERSKR
ncbi:MAG: SsrA-binding protein SmpB [Candidatus Berkelbacteria bacterium]|nr:MAG: SsrA-binding protein SmpB [Candidatus Berkelbacteria bacterium]QQG51977.1 MAG: SsrA-binding protein SmpB [Candidatus Berkelbacteria bacterium]